MLAMGGTSVAHAEAEAPSMCGRRGTIVDHLISMQKPSVTGVWRDKTMFIYRDSEDNSVWAFSIENTNAHPAAMCQREVKDGDGVKVETGQICAASEKVCASFRQQMTDNLAKPAALMKK
jgi:hypothetical protein